MNLKKNLLKGILKGIDLLMKPFYGTEIVLAFHTFTDDVINLYEDIEDRESKRVLHTKHTRRL